MHNKKLIATTLLLTATLAASLTACGNKTATKAPEPEVKTETTKSPVELNTEAATKKEEPKKDEEEDEKFLLAYHPLHYGAENQQRIHIEEKVPEASVHKHMGNNLPPAEAGRRRIEESEVTHHHILIDEGRQEHYNVYENEVLGDYGNIGQETAS